MPYGLEFLPSAQKEWDKLGPTIKAQSVKKLRKRLSHPRVPVSALHGMPDHYKIKLRRLGCRLVYRVSEHAITVTVIAVGRCDDGEIYEIARRR